MLCLPQFVPGGKTMRRFLSLLTLTWLIVIAIAPGPACAVDASPTVLITGANRGIGLEFARQYAALGWRVIATCRTPEQATELGQIAANHPNLTIERLDITDPVAVARLAKRYAGQPVDVLLNNAALLGSRADQRFGRMDFDLFTRILAVNTMGTLRVTEAFAPHVAASRQKKIVTLGSSAGSIAMLNAPPDFYAYRASKAALHLLMRNVSLELSSQDIVVGLINPGLVDTRGFAQIGPDDPVPEDYAQVIKLIRSGALELTTPQEAVKRMIGLIDSLSREQSGQFLSAEGQALPW